MDAMKYNQKWECGLQELGLVDILNWSNPFQTLKPFFSGISWCQQSFYNTIGPSYSEKAKTPNSEKSKHLNFLEFKTTSC